MRCPTELRSMGANDNLFHPNNKLKPETKKGREGDMQEEN